jgi:Catalase
MAAPGSADRFFKQLATIWPALLIAFAFARRSMMPRFGRTADEIAAEGVARRDAETAVGLLGLTELLGANEKRLVIDERRERLEPHERELYLHVARLIADTMVRDFRKAQGTPPGQPARRSQHAKHHGCVEARFVVDAELAPEYAVGVFRPGARHEAVLRFSNAHGSPQPDKKGDGRGLAIKLRPGDRRGDQDFVLVNHPVFFVDDIAEYAQFMGIIHSHGSALMTGLRLLAFFVPWRLRKGLIFLRLRFTYIKDPFSVTYHSMSPFALGDKVVRYVVTPANPAPHDAGAAAEPAREADFLRERMGERLSADIAFDFSVRVRDQPTPDDVEHASRDWARPNDRTVRLARIEVPRQAFATADQLWNCENLRFSPWNARPEHRPLGGINRIRLLAYLVSGHMRHRLNMTASK